MSRAQPLSQPIHGEVVIAQARHVCMPLALAMQGVFAGLEQSGTTLNSCRGATPEATLLNLAARWQALPAEAKATGEYRAVLDNAFHTYGPDGPLGDNELYLSVREGLDGQPRWRDQMKALLHHAAGIDADGLPTGAAMPAPGSQADPQAAPAGPSQPTQAVARRPAEATAGEPAAPAESGSRLTPLSQQGWSGDFFGRSRRDDLQLLDTATGPGPVAGPSSRPGVGAATGPAASRGPLVPSSLEAAGVGGPALRILQRAVAHQVLDDASFDELLQKSSPRTLALAIRYFVPNLMKPVTDSDDESDAGASVDAQPGPSASAGQAGPEAGTVMLPPPPPPAQAQLPLPGG